MLSLGIHYYPLTLPFLLILLGRRGRLPRLLSARRAGPGPGDRHPGFLPARHRGGRRAAAVAPARSAPRLRLRKPRHPDWRGPDESRQHPRPRRAGHVDRWRGNLRRDIRHRADRGAPRRHPEPAQARSFRKAAPVTNAPSSFGERLSALSPVVLKSIRRGIEKESLRVRPDGALALTPHPRALGSALKHPHITTDFSEALIELITGVHTEVPACLEEMKHIHQFVIRHIGDEMLWGASMPCSLPDENAIPIARYGASNIGRAKTVYRIGLSHRYGRRMQMIAGLHYNFSLPDSAWPLAGLGGPSEGYFALIRNFRRLAWLLLYLFGASPAVCASFVEGRKHALEELAPGTLYLPHATSLRMGRLGYLSEAQDSLAVSYNSIDSYTACLHDVLTKPYPPYEAIGIRDGDGNYRQLATSLLQIVQQ